ncbi:outer membrane protein [Phreatobacter aquaticus]|nr:outer membrane beta-barrel protein [Phreatobacter aquaticus]
MPIAAEVSARGFSWTGVYAGLHAGYGFANTSISVPGIVGFSGLGSNGWQVGGKIGADYQFAQRWVIGGLVEGNLSGIDTVISLAGNSVKLSADRRWAVRGRLGFLITPETMLYATGGWSQGHITASGFGGSAGLTTSGWQIGGGIETRLAGNWFMHAEYIHTYSNSIGQFAPVSIKPTLGTARLGLSYRFGLGAAEQYQAFAAPRRADWSGFYAGVQGGYGFGNTTLAVPGLFSFRGIGSQGLFGGVLGGYDHQFAGTNIVAGIEADAGISTVRTTLNVAGFGASIGSDWNAGVRGRLGYVIGGSVMPYLSAGYGWTHVNISLPGASAGWMSSGLQLGAGVETMLTANLALRAEYIHQFGTSRELVAPLTAKIDSGRARVGLTWKFGGEGAAVTARY